MDGTPVRLSIEDVGKAFIADHISDSHEIEIAFHVHPDLAKFYLDLLRSNGVYEYTTKGMQFFLTNIRLCRMYVERYGEFYSSTHAVLKDETACSQLEMNCPMLLSICNVVARKNLCTLEELFGIKPLPVKYANWISNQHIVKEKKTEKVSYVGDKQSVSIHNLIKLVICAVFLCVLLVGAYIGFCHFKRNVAREEILNHIQWNSSEVMPLELEIDYLWSDIKHSNSDHDYERFLLIAEFMESNLIPKAREYANLFDDITPQNEDLKEYHNLRAKRAQMLCNGFAQYKDAIKDKNLKQMAEALDCLEQCSNIRKQCNDIWPSIKEKYDITEDDIDVILGRK